MRADDPPEGTELTPETRADGLVIVLHTSLYLNATAVVFPKFDFVPLLDSITSLKISTLYLVPPMIVLLTKHPAVTEKGREEKLNEVVREVMVGAAPLSDELVSAFRKRFPTTSIAQGCASHPSTGTSCSLMRREQTA